MMDYLLLIMECFQFDFCFLEVFLVLILERKTVFSLIVARHKDPLFTPFPKCHHPQFWARGRSVTQGLCDKQLAAPSSIWGLKGLFTTLLNPMPCSSKTFFLPNLVWLLTESCDQVTLACNSTLKSKILGGTLIPCSSWECKIIGEQSVQERNGPSGLHAVFFS